MGNRAKTVSGPLARWSCKRRPQPAQLIEAPKDLVYRLIKLFSRAYRGAKRGPLADWLNERGARTPAAPEHRVHVIDANGNESPRHPKALLSKSPRSNHATDR
jgi:hypothetical protein